MPPGFLDEKDRKVLELDARRAVYHLIRKFAGCHFRELERISGLPSGTLKHHLGFLARNGLVSRVKEDNSLRYFPRDFSSSDKSLMGMLRQGSLRKILLFILVRKQCMHKDIVEFTGLSPSTVTWHLMKLERGGIVEATRSGRTTRYRIIADKDVIIKLLITYKGSFLDSLVDHVIEMWEISA